MFVMFPSLAAVALVTAKPFESVNGVGGSAVRLLAASFCRVSWYAACASLGTSLDWTLKNEVSAVPVYSG